MEKKTVPPKRKHVVMWVRVRCYYSTYWLQHSIAHYITFSLVRLGDMYMIYRSNRRSSELTYSILAAQTWFTRMVYDYIVQNDAQIVAGGVYFGGE